MSQQAKLLERLRRKPKDFSWDELVQLLTAFGYEVHGNSGSRRRFINTATAVSINMHEPHPRKALKSYQIRDVLDHLKQEGYL